MADNKSEEVKAPPTEEQRDQRPDYTRVIKLVNGDTIIAMVGGLGYKYDMASWQLYMVMKVIDGRLYPYFPEADMSNPDHQDLLLQKSQSLFGAVLPTQKLMNTYLSEVDRLTRELSMEKAAEETKH